MSLKKLIQSRLQNKITLMVVMIVILCTLVSTVYSLQGVKRNVQERLDVYGIFLTEAFATFSTDDILAWNYPSLQSSVDRVVEYDHYILAVEVYHEDSLVAEYKKNTTEKGIKYETPVTTKVLNEEKKLGSIKIILSSEKYYAFYRQQVYSLFLLAFILGLGYIILIYLSIRKMILAPMKKIEEGARIIGKGNFDHQIDIKRDDEMGILAETLNMVASNLKQSKNETENYKKHLEKKIKELEKFHELTVGRELKMIDLKKELNVFKKQKGGTYVDTKLEKKLLLKRVESSDCWDYWSCDEKTKKHCPAYKTDSGNECWLVAYEYCPLLKKEFKKCTECPWYKKNNSKKNK